MHEAVTKPHSRFDTVYLFYYLRADLLSDISLLVFTFCVPRVSTRHRLLTSALSRIQGRGRGGGSRGETQEGDAQKPSKPRSRGAGLAAAGRGVVLVVLWDFPTRQNSKNTSGAFESSFGGEHAGFIIKYN